LKSTKEVFIVHGVSHSPNTLPTTLQSCFPYYKLIPPLPPFGIQGSTEQLCGFGLWEHLPSTHITDCSLENMNPDVTPKKGKAHCSFHKRLNFNPYTTVHTFTMAVKSH
jgi:hypothetical protein